MSDFRYTSQEDGFQINYCNFAIAKE